MILMWHKNHRQGKMEVCGLKIKKLKLAYNVEISILKEASLKSQLSNV